MKHQPLLAQPERPDVAAARSSAITGLFRSAVRRARRTGLDERIVLKGGAELVVRCRDERITLTIKRAGAPVGATELRTFRRDCEVPATAEVLTPPAQGKRGSCWFVTLRWRDAVFPGPAS